jgi:hypothetical protein
MVPPTTGVPSSGVAPVAPATGAYLGAWLQPNTSQPGTGTFAGEQGALAQVQGALGRPLPLLHLYVGWDAAAPVARLHAIQANGSIPILDWGCPPSAAAVASGSEDAHIVQMASALRTDGRPLFLRWCWEMNLVTAHPGVDGPTTFVAAWRHIWTLFHDHGVSNAAFVWCPALRGRNPAPYFPGDAQVDWIGVDGYDNAGVGDFASVFGTFYATWSGQGKPMMVGETGAPAASQVAYLDSAGRELPTMPAFKAWVYFDAVGPTNDWRLTPAGLQALVRLSQSPALSAA